MRTDKQTAVQWLIESITLGLSEKAMKTAFDKAKEMEREALIEFYEDGLYAANYPHALNGPAYYEKEYGNKN